MNKLKAILGLVGFLVLAGAGIWYLIVHISSTNTTLRDKYAAAYDAHALGDQFNLLDKSWAGTTWTYVYQGPLDKAAAVKAIQSQFTGNGYQVIQAHPDTADTVYRDLITGDIAVTAVVEQHTPGTVGVNVTVTGIQQ